MERVDLIWLGSSGKMPSWHLGKVWPVAPTLAALNNLVQNLLPASKAHAWYFWDSSFGAPDETMVQKAMVRPGDVWHAGLRLGLGGLPKLIDFVAPTWMLNRDPPVDIEATSWRLSLNSQAATRQIAKTPQRSKKNRPTLSQTGTPKPTIVNIQIGSFCT